MKAACLAAAFLSFAVIVFTALGTEVPDPASDLVLAGKAEDLREAAFFLDTEMTGTGRYFAVGFFISGDGLAIASITVAGDKQARSVRTLNGQKLAFGRILRLFPEENVLLMKFNHRPRVYIPIAATPPAEGDTLAIITLQPKSEGATVAPPVVGSVLAKRKEIIFTCKKPRMGWKISLGAGITRQQLADIHGASALINENGELAATMNSTVSQRGQILILASPLPDIAGKLDEFVAAEPMPFPLPQDLNPLDPALGDPVFAEFSDKLKKRDFESARNHIEQVLKLHPESYHVRQTILDAPIWKHQVPPLKLDDIPKPEPDAENRIEAYAKHLLRSKICFLRDDAAGEISELKAAKEFAPEGEVLVRFNLALTFLEADPRDRANLEKARKALLDLEPYLADTIGYFEELEMVLSRLHQFEDADRYTQRVHTLEAIYQRQRGQGLEVRQ